jgi:GNAT acetyltransferase
MTVEAKLAGMNPIDFLLLQMELEGIKRAGEELITRISPNVDEFPLVLCARTTDNQRLICFDDALTNEVRARMPMDELGGFKTEAAIEVFERHGIHAKANRFRTYIFQDGFPVAEIGEVKCFSQDDPKISAFGFSGLADKVFAIEQDGEIVSACVSSRQNATCAEAWVFTHPDQRHKGLAQSVVKAWAADLKKEGIIPFYSHNVENDASARLAKKLGLMHVFDETVIEKAS